jgi:hypothetical protein
MSSDRERVAEHLEDIARFLERVSAGVLQEDVRVLREAIALLAPQQEEPRSSDGKYTESELREFLLQADGPRLGEQIRYAMRELEKIEAARAPQQEPLGDDIWTIVGCIGYLEKRGYTVMPAPDPPTYTEPAPEEALVGEVLAELQHARSKFPGDNVTTLALVEEVGELAKATFEESPQRVRKEAVQVAAMAMRVVLDGDATLKEWRHAKNLAPLATPQEPEKGGL